MSNNDLLAIYEKYKKRFQESYPDHNYRAGVIQIIFALYLREKEKSNQELFSLRNLVENCSEIEFNDLKELFFKKDEFKDNSEDFRLFLRSGMIALASKEVFSNTFAYDNEKFLLETLVPGNQEYDDSLNRLARKSKSFDHWKEIFMRSNKHISLRQLSLNKMTLLATNFDELFYVFLELKDRPTYDKLLSSAEKAFDWVRINMCSPSQDHRILSVEKIKGISEPLENWKYAFDSIKDTSVIVDDDMKNIVLEKWLESAKKFTEIQEIVDNAQGKLKLNALIKQSESIG